MMSDTHAQQGHSRTHASPAPWPWPYASTPPQLPGTTTRARTHHVLRNLFLVSFPFRYEVERGQRGVRVLVTWLC